MSVIILSFEHHAGDSAIWLGSTLIWWKSALGTVRDLPPLFPLPPASLAAQRLFRVPSCCKGTIHLQTSMPSLVFEPRAWQSASLTTVLDGR
ncbi:hypothetical protein TNCV_1588741 [Trichonephila clavipes]|uniref:Uncharacterized protein n=1 Tax=Trichonephila clavipes TaxID=2585209 RepID=A0A8X6RJF7_TRICX|nr:hypothetical protein TNCV_1588741 [Trichonephila clavipes]